MIMPTFAARICVPAAALMLPLAHLQADRAPSSASTPPGAQARPAVTRLAADVSIQRGFLDRDGRPLGATVPPIRYRMERTRERGYWKTVMRITSATQAPALTFSGKVQEIPSPIARIEDDGDGSMPRVYGRDGQLLQFPDPSTRAKIDLAAIGRHELESPLPADGPPRHPVTGDGWLESILPSAHGASARRSALERRYGNARGAVRGLDRFIAVTADVTAEVLVDRMLAVPVEVNVVRNGQLESHTGYTYVALEGGGYLRQRMQREQRATGMKNDGRLSIAIDLSNVTVATGGAR